MASFNSALPLTWSRALGSQVRYYFACGSKPARLGPLAMLLHETAEHVRRARELIATGDPGQLRYAALELRMAIEAAFYRLVPQYREELSDELLREWRPQHILKALVEIDPGVERDAIISIGCTPSGGGPARPFMARRQRGVTHKLLREYYHKLAKSLHAPTPHDRPKTAESLKAFLEAAATRLEEHCRETTVIATMHPGITIQCDCGRTFRRSMHAVRTTGMAVCPSMSCGTIFDLTENATGAHIAIREEMFLCPACGTSISLPSRVVRAGAKFDCSSCKASLQIHDGLWVTRSDTLSCGAA
jgi:predicted RNA-binding Zn-ribbon protein involved in translation (DUF1610 family)